MGKRSDNSVIGRSLLRSESKPHQVRVVICVDEWNMHERHILYRKPYDDNIKRTITIFHSSFYFMNQQINRYYNSLMISSFRLSQISDNLQSRM